MFQPQKKIQTAASEVNNPLKKPHKEDGSLLQKFKPFINLDDLPGDIKISTITITCRFDTLFNIESIGKYVDLRHGGIVGVDCGGHPESARAIIERKKRRKKKKPKVIGTRKGNTFYNQASVTILSDNCTASVKLFKNGSVHITGCKTLTNFIDVMTKLCRELKKVKAIVDKKTPNNIILRPFAVDPSKMYVSKMKDVKIRMINTNFKLNYMIDRAKLHSTLLNQGLNSTFEPCVHAGVRIKYNYMDKDDVTILVFQSGSIIITGAKNQDHIVKAYEFIMRKLHSTFKVTNKAMTLDELLQRSEIKDMVKSHLEIKEICI